MPRHRSSPPPPPPPSPSSARRHERHGRRDIALDAAPIDAALVHVVPDARARAFVLRCILEEGPRHHRVASFTILRLLARIIEDLGGAGPEAPDSTESTLEMRLPPSVASLTDDAEFPIGIPKRMIREVLGEKSAEVALECLGDGPPHHALANAAMAWMLQSIHERLRGPGKDDDDA